MIALRQTLQNAEHEPPKTGSRLAFITLVCLWLVPLCWWPAHRSPFQYMKRFHNIIIGSPGITGYWIPRDSYLRILLAPPCRLIICILISCSSFFNNWKVRPPLEWPSVLWVAQPTDNKMATLVASTCLTRTDMNGLTHVGNLVIIIQIAPSASS